MPLVLTLRSKETFSVAGVVFEVERVQDDRNFVVRDIARGKSFNINDERSVEIMNDVMVSAGNKAPLAMARVVIDAPKDMKIIRGETDRKIENVRG